MKKWSLLFTCLLAYSLAFGQFPIGEQGFSYNDPARGGRTVNGVLYYPATMDGANVPVATGVFPVIAFGHGAAMTSDAFSNIKDFLVPEGYIVIMPDTESSLIPAPSHPDFGQDLAFLVEQMQAEGANSGSDFFNKVSDRSALFGHSMGGGASFLGAENNTNITTLVNLAAAETSPSAIGAAANVTVPTLVVAGEDDCISPTASDQVPMYNATAAACKMYIEIKDGSHCNFTNGDGNTPFDPANNCYFGETTCGGGNSADQPNQQAKMEAVVLPWMDYWLYDDCDAWNILQTNASNATDYSSFQQSCTLDTPMATVSAAGPVVFCEGGMVTLNSTITSDLACAFQWFDGTGAISGATNNSLVVNASGTYFLEVASADGLSTSNTNNIVVTVNPSPNADAGMNQTICSGETATLTASGGGTYAWSNGSSGSSIMVSPTSNMTYTVTVTDNGCSATDNVMVMVNALPNADAGMNQTICSGETATLSASGGGTYAWSDGSSGSSIMVSPTSDMTYTVTVTDNGCSATDNVMVMVNALPNADAGMNQTICSGETATLTASGGGTYAWSTGDTGSSIMVSPTSNATYTVTVTDNGCTATDNVMVMVNEPIVPTLSYDGSILTSSIANAYQWYLNGNPIPGGTQQTIDPYSEGEGDYYVETIDANGCMSSSEVLFVMLSSVQEISSLLNFEISPNPSTTYFNLWVESSASLTGRLEVISITGQSVFSKELNQQYTITETIQIGHLPNGIYLVHLQTERGVATQKLIKTQ